MPRQPCDNSRAAFRWAGSFTVPTAAWTCTCLDSVHPRPSPPGGCTRQRARPPEDFAHPRSCTPLRSGGAALPSLRLPPLVWKERSRMPSKEKPLVSEQGRPPSRTPNNRQAPPGPCSDGARTAADVNPAARPQRQDAWPPGHSARHHRGRGTTAADPRAAGRAWAKKRGRERHVLENSTLCTALSTGQFGKYQDPGWRAGGHADSRQNARRRQSSAGHPGAGIPPEQSTHEPKRR